MRSDLADLLKRFDEIVAMSPDECLWIQRNPERAKAWMVEAAAVLRSLEQQNAFAD